MALAFSIGQLRSRTYPKGTVAEQAAELDAAEPRRGFCPRKVPQIEVGGDRYGWLAENHRMPQKSANHRVTLHAGHRNMSRQAVICRSGKGQKEALLY